LPVPPHPTDEENAVIICHCAAVSDRVLTEAVESGARTLGHVCRATDAGRDCGVCVFNVKRVITEHIRSIVEQAEVCSA
jgi:bacterioferritin-associated ferredoxin